MRISTAQYYRVNAEQMQARQNKVAESQAKLGSGKQMLHPSENPSKADLISRLESARERQKAPESDRERLGAPGSVREISMTQTAI